ncbi:MAG: hypothetical protein BWY82_01786 [Verrucomicrobia bacterium ADurb.Bin474]|nr:MAG: hypothetical protein BWY82_01786 [Verrucomicrobia bacterium ADurb.Bin474]
MECGYQTKKKTTDTHFDWQGKADRCKDTFPGLEGGDKQGCRKSAEDSQDCE